MEKKQLRLPLPPFEVVLRGSPQYLADKMVSYFEDTHIEEWNIGAELEVVGQNREYVRIAITSTTTRHSEKRDFIGIITLLEQTDDLTFFRVPPRDSWDFRVKESMNEQENHIIYKDHEFCEFTPEKIGLLAIQDILDHFWQEGIAATAVINDLARPMGKRGSLD